MTEITWIGQIDYDLAWEQQKALVAARTADSTLADRLLLLEHPPTFTLGRRGKKANLLLDEAALAYEGITVRWVDRGGDITYHGPGQLVGYPILNLKRLFQARGQPRPDLHQYLRDLESVLIETLAHFGVAGWPYPGYTGVWVDTAVGPRKIAAIGIKVSSRGISSHGFALNVNPTMSHFSYIVPCGIREHGVVSLAQYLERPVTIAEVLPPLRSAFTAVFSVEVASVSAYNDE